ncbi:sensor histidine kinase [Paenibacillus apiarius]|uniref:sensor histidine kinase n=1 Tax=Paenibacillus apiarius TaxID=46240 RepID=UPI0019808E2F|nr:sensor histidine kinase [Paenibacillus apiarius]MBN3523625.1 sensor histidine kinase [Paenibacillus apiarius]
MKLFIRLYNKFLQSSHIRLTTYFFIVLLPLVVVSLYVNNQANQIIVKQATEQTRQKLESVMVNLELTLQNSEVLTNLIATNKKIIESLEVNENELSPQTIVQYSELLEELWNVTAVSQMVSQISIYHAGTHTMLSTKFGGRRIGGTEERKWLASLAAHLDSGTELMMPEQKIGGNHSFGQLIDSDTISFTRTMDLYNIERKPNLLIVTLHKNKLTAILKPLLASAHTSVVLRGRDGHAILSPSDRIQSVSIEEADRLGVSVESARYPWTLEIFLPIDEIYAETKTMRHYTYLIIASSFMLALFISWGIYNRIASPLWQLKDAMKGLIEGNYNIQLDTGRKDEFGYLMNGYNQMVKHQKHLIQDHYEQQLRIARTELTFLQSQINPHFLYNTLDSIYWTAQNYEAEEISEMVLNLSHFFRLSLHKGQDTFTVDETMTHLDYYIRIQQIRFLDSFQVIYKVQEESKSIPVLKLLLQPLVENAVIHGLEQKRHGGVLTISSVVESGKLILTVQDNGAGISEERIQSIHQVLSEIAGKTTPLSFLETADKELYGLSNVFSRVKMFYGDPAQIIFQSELGVGTTVTLLLPIENCTNQNN